jgi:hypothetical protein
MPFFLEVFHPVNADEGLTEIFCSAGPLKRDIILYWGGTLHTRKRAEDPSN